MKRRTHKTERGAALVLALLIMLVLSGLGLVAMKATTDSTTMAGTHRLQTQTMSLSDSINQLGIARSGRQASAYHAQMTSQSAGIMGDEIGDNDERHSQDGFLRRGGYVLFSSDSGDLESSADFSMDEGAGGQVLDGNNFGAVASDDAYDTSYQYIVRDAVLGPRAPGFGDEYCFIRVTIGSRADIGTAGFDDDDAEADARAQRNRALGRNVSHSMIGPVECN